MPPPPPPNVDANNVNELQDETEYPRKPNTPLAAMLPTKYLNVDVQELFPDFRQDSVSRLLIYNVDSTHYTFIYDLTPRTMQIKISTCFWLLRIIFFPAFERKPPHSFSNYIPVFAYNFLC